MTPKQIVLKKWPDAMCEKRHTWYAISAGRTISELRASPRAAWADAAKRLEGK